MVAPRAAAVMQAHMQAPGAGGRIAHFPATPGDHKATAVPESSSVKPLVGVIMGSRSDWDTMQHAVQTLVDLGVPHEARVVSAHRTPDLLFDYAEAAAQRGLKVIIAGAGGAAHLPGMCAAKTRLPVLGVPVQSKALNGLDSLLSIVQMPAGIPVATLAIGRAGAMNAALLAAAILANEDAALAERLENFRAEQTRKVLEDAPLELPKRS